MFFKRKKQPVPASIGSIPRTDWDVVLSADERLLKVFVEEFESRYRLPLVASIMSMLRDERLAHELFDNFLQDRVMTRLLQKTAHPRKGRFRHLAKKAFQNFALKHLRDESRKLDKPGTGTALNAVAVYDKDPFSDEEYQWGLAIFREAQAAVAEALVKRGNSLHIRIWKIKRGMSPERTAKDLAIEFAVMPHNVYHAIDLCEEFFSKELRRRGREAVGYDSKDIDEWLARVGRAIKQGGRQG